METPGDLGNEENQDDEDDPRRLGGQSPAIHADFLWDYSDLNTISNTPTKAPLDLIRWDGLERNDANTNNIIKTTQLQQQQQQQQQQREKDSAMYQESTMHFWSVHEIQRGDAANQRLPPNVIAPAPVVYRSRHTNMIGQESGNVAGSSSSTVKPAVISLDASEVLAAMGGTIPWSAGHAESLIHSTSATLQGINIFKTNSSSSSKGKERVQPVGNQTLTKASSEAGGSAMVMGSASSAALVVDGMEIHDLAPANAGMVKHMNPEERALVLLKRKLRNRQSAKNSRLRRQEVIHELTETVYLLKDESEKIKAACEQVAEENRRLKEQLDWHRRKSDHSDTP
mmetsp:Transcript_2685/g.4706  ORF Transcript_2685/g.4706 Transcript_2685/m.4706 type:complete len:341 (-) Transcript_2685:237-1259(-)